MSPELNLARSSMFRPSSYWNCLLFDLPKPNLLFHLTLLLPIHPSFFWQKDLSKPQISSITPLTQCCKGLSTACRAKTKLKAFSLSPHSFFLPHVGNPATLPPLIVSSTVLVMTHIDLSHAAFIPLAIVKTFPLYLFIYLFTKIYIEYLLWTRHCEGLELSLWW